MFQIFLEVKKQTGEKTGISGEYFAVACADHARRLYHDDENSRLIWTGPAATMRPQNNMWHLGITPSCFVISVDNISRSHVQIMHAGSITTMKIQVLFEQGQRRRCARKIICDIRSSPNLVLWRWAEQEYFFAKNSNWWTANTAFFLLFYSPPSYLLLPS